VKLTLPPGLPALLVADTVSCTVVPRVTEVVAALVLLLMMVVLTDGVALFTVWPPVRLPVLLPKLPVPVKAALTGCAVALAASVEVVKMAVVTPPLVVTEIGLPAVPSIVNTTEPVAPVGVMVAVKLTDCPNAEGFSDEVTDTWLAVTVGLSAKFFPVTVASFDTEKLSKADET